jgi:hypothetical protein
VTGTGEVQAATGQPTSTADGNNVVSIHEPQYTSPLVGLLLLINGVIAAMLILFIQRRGPSA